MRNTAAKKVFEYCQDHEEGFLITGDAGFGVWEEFQDKMPEQYINTGINEAAMTGLAAGMALSGHKVFVYNIIPFLMMRNYEQVRVTIAYQNLPVVLIGIGSGITYAPAGMTHYSIEDIGLAKSLPNMNIISPSDPIQVKKAMDFAFESDNPTFIRISRSGEPTLFHEDIDITRPLYLKEGDEIAIIFHGSIVDEVIEASRQLDGVAVISMPLIAPLDDNAVEEMLNNYGTVYVVEEHFCEGGLGTILRDFVCDRGLQVNVKKIAIANSYIHEIGDCVHLRKKLGIDAASIIAKVKHG